MKINKSDLVYAQGIDSVIHQKPTYFFWIFPIVLSLLIISILTWMILSETDVVSPTQAKIIASKGMHLVQPKETSEIESVPIKEGDLVRQGDLLVQFAKRELQIELNSIQQELNLTRAEVYRLESMLAFIDQADQKPTVPKDVPEQLLHFQQVLLNNQKSSHTSELNTLDLKIESAKQEVAYLRGEINKLTKLIPLSQKKVDRLAPLVSENLATQNDYDQHLEDLLGKKEDKRIKWLEIKMLKTQIQYTIEEKRLIRDNYKTEVSQKLVDAYQRLEIQKLSRDKVMQSIRLKSIHAPIDGVIHNLRLYTVGTVVQSGEVMMQILPGESPLEVEAKVLNRDIGFVTIGQRVKFKIDSFPFTKYGYIEGKVKNIEHASVLDEQLGDIYPTIVELTTHHIEADGKRIRLLPGMSGIVDIKTGRRKLIEYIIAPFLRYKDEALKER